MEIAIVLAAAGVLAFLVSAAVTPAVISVSTKREWYDIPNERKIHTSPIPRLGGVALFAGLLVASVAVPLLVPVFFPGARVASFTLRYLAVFVAFSIIHIMGLVDDFHNLHALLKLLLQIVAAALIMVGGFSISRIHVPGLPVISLGIFAYPVTILWIVTISNAINLVDGLDGLAGGITGLSALSLGIISLLHGQAIPALFSFCLLGTVAGFLVFNLPPARIFMGDSGSLLLGFVLAVIPLMLTPGTTLVGDLFAPATIMLIPILDTISAIWRRVRERRAIHSPDKEHIHHKLLALGWEQTAVLSLLCACCAYFGAASVASVFLRRGPALLLLAFVWMTGVGAYIVLRSIARKRRAAPATLQRHT
jgi:UDP-GlcNAc:undecaprenyl-phosphate/decaprenyl-phosphate GlcNAc-1-phosphate transferase